MVWQALKILTCSSQVRYPSFPGRTQVSFTRPSIPTAMGQSRFLSSNPIYTRSNPPSVSLDLDTFTFVHVIMCVKWRSKVNNQS
jgi:hypothetical protein